jgi:hypothetical protein
MEHVARMTEMANGYKILVGKQEETMYFSRETTRDNVRNLG